MFIYYSIYFSLGYGYEPLPSTSHIEEENDQMTNELKDKIHALKSLSIDISTEVKYQDKMLRDMVSNNHELFQNIVPTFSSLIDVFFIG